MRTLEITLLLENLLSRVETKDDGNSYLVGKLTEGELCALRAVLATIKQRDARGSLEGPTHVDSSGKSEVFPDSLSAQAQSGGVATEPEKCSDLSPQKAAILNWSALSHSPPDEARLCLDFGTAMSKATLVRQLDEDDSEEIEVLRLGVPGDQEEVSEAMLISSVYIDNAGVLWFGKWATDRSIVEGSDGSRGRLDNIKRRLSEEGWDEIVGERFNPTGEDVTQGEMVLAYVTFLTWAANVCLWKLGYSNNVVRRFAMPCLGGEKRREAVHRLSAVMGEAQVLADTFGERLVCGLPLSVFLEVARSVKGKVLDYPFVLEEITEPRGVASSMVNWRSPVDLLMLVVDVGAGTSDLSLYRFKFDPERNKCVGYEVEGSARVLTEAGNHLDRVLMELVLRKGGVTATDPSAIGIRGALELQIRELKESLFNDEFVLVPLRNGTDVEVEIGEFLELDAVKAFGDSLHREMISILEDVNEAWVDWIRADANRYLVLTLTGGGRDLPMVKSLAEAPLVVRGIRIPVAMALDFPRWLEEVDENLRQDFPRIAVSLGGARLRVVEEGGVARVTAGDVLEPPKLGGFYSRGE